MPNKFKKTDEGKKIRILQICGAYWIKKNQTYTIKKVHSEIRVTFDGMGEQWTCNTVENCFEFVKEEELKIGDKIVLINDVQSFKKEVEKEIIGFVDNDKDKILIEGLLPGGWLRSSNITKVIDFKTLRVKSLLELYDECYENLSFVRIIIKSISKYNIFGKPLQDLNIQKKGSKIHLRTNQDTITLQEEILTDLSIPVPNLCLSIISKKELELIYGQNHVLIGLMTPIFENQLEFSDSKIYEMIKSFESKGFFIMDSINILPAFIKVVPKIEINQEKNEKKHNILF